MHADGHVEKQRGVIRVNCMDCLDRTNITQVRCLVFCYLDYFLCVHENATKIQHNFYETQKLGCFIIMSCIFSGVSNKL